MISRQAILIVGIAVTIVITSLILEVQLVRVVHVNVQQVKDHVMVDVWILIWITITVALVVLHVPILLSMLAQHVRAGNVSVQQTNQPFAMDTV